MSGALSENTYALEVRPVTTTTQSIGAVNLGWRHLLIGVSATPLTPPSAAALRATLIAFMTEQPRHPLSCTLDADETRYVTVAPHERAAHAHQVVVDAGFPTGQLPERVLEAALNNFTLGNLPFRVLVGPDSITLLARHSLGDGASASALLVAMSRNDLDYLNTLVCDLTVGRLLWATARQAPGNLRMWRRYARETRSRRTELVKSNAVGGWSSNSPVATTIVSARIEGSAASAFNELRRRTFPDITSSALTITLMFKALVAEGIAIDSQQAFLLVDIRRYLPKTNTISFGNGSKSVFLAANLNDPADVHAHIHSATSTGRALAGTMHGIVNQLRARSSTLGKGASKAPDGHTASATGGRVLAASVMSRIPHLERPELMPWAATGTPSTIGLGVSPGNQGLDVFVFRAPGRIEIAMPVAPDDPDRAAITAALERIAHDPVGLFTPVA